MLRANKRPTCKDCGEEFWPNGLTTRYCRACSDVRFRKASDQRKERKKRTVKRPTIKGWKEKRAKAAQEKYCGACGCELPKDRSPAIDHIVPAAIVDELSRLMLKALAETLTFEPRISPEYEKAMRGESAGIEEIKTYDAEDERNLLAVCSSGSNCHGKKRRAEIKLERGDVLGFLSELNRLKYPMDRVKEALRLYGLAT